MSPSIGSPCQGSRISSLCSDVPLLIPIVRLWPLSPVRRVVSDGEGDLDGSYPRRDVDCTGVEE